MTTMTIVYMFNDSFCESEIFQEKIACFAAEECLHWATTAQVCPIVQLSTIARVID